MMELIKGKSFGNCEKYSEKIILLQSQQEGMQ